MKETLAYDGLPPLEPSPSRTDTVIFTNISSIYLRADDHVRLAYSASLSPSYSPGILVTHGGKLACSSPSPCSDHVFPDADYIDLQGGSIAPGLVSAGSMLGIQAIDQELSTQDGYAPDTLSGSISELAGGSGTLVRAADGLQFGTRDAL